MTNIEMENMIERITVKSQHETGIVYDFVMSCSTMLAIPQEYEPGKTLTLNEWFTLFNITKRPGINSASLCRKWNRTRGAVSQTVKKLKLKQLICSKKKSNQVLLYPSTEGKRIIDRFVSNELNDSIHIYTKLVNMGCSEKDIISFYKVMKCYIELLHKDPGIMWQNFLKRNNG